MMVFRIQRSDDPTKTNRVQMRKIQEALFRTPPTSGIPMSCTTLDDPFFCGRVECETKHGELVQARLASAGTTFLVHPE